MSSFTVLAWEAEESKGNGNSWMNFWKEESDVDEKKEGKMSWNLAIRRVMPFFILPYKSNLACFCPQARSPWPGFAFVKKIFSRRFQFAVLVSLTAVTNSTMPQWFNLIQMYCLLPSPSLTWLVIIQEELRLLLSCDTTIVNTYPGHCRRCGQACKYCTLLPLNFHWPELAWPQPNFKGAQEGRK